MKQCTRCNTNRELEKYRKSSSCKDGRHTICNKCKKKYSRTKTGKIKSIYDDQRNHSKARKHPMPNYTKRELINWCLKQPLYHTLHTKWKASKFLKSACPSCDRIDDGKPYTLNNLQLMTWQENNKKSHANKCKEVFQYDKNTNGVINKHSSIAMAGKTIGIAYQGILACCKGTQITAGGYKWGYVYET